MPSILFGLGRSALAVLIIISITGTGCSQNIQTIGTYLHRAFWCSVIETTVWCPTKVITYFTRSNRRIPPRLLQKLHLIISFLWWEMTAHIVAQAVQPFIVHASLSSSLRETSTATDAPKVDPWRALAHSAVLFCVLQIIHSVSLCVRCIQRSLKWHTDRHFRNVDPEDVPTTHSHVLTAVHGCVCHLFGTAALYIERIATGTLITGLATVSGDLHGPIYWACTAAAWPFLKEAHDFVWRMAGEWDDQGSGLMADQGGWSLVRQQTMYGEMIDRLCLRFAWAFAASVQGLVSWRLPRLGRWHCPELAALWAEGEVQQFYVGLLAESSPLALLAPWSHNVRHIDEWRTAGLSGDYVPRNYSAASVRGPRGWSAQFCYMVLGRILVVLVCFLEAAFVWFFFLALAMAGIFWCEERKLPGKLRQFRRLIRTY